MDRKRQRERGRERKLREGASEKGGETGNKRRKQEGLLGVKFPLDMICGYGDVMKSVKWK